MSSGQLRKHEQFRSRFLRNQRDLIVYTPPGYADQSWRHFPVLYLHDGQNLFDGATSFIPGQDWRVGQSADHCIQSGAVAPLIIVGMYNTKARIGEYTPTHIPKLGGGRADRYAKFLTISEPHPDGTRTLFFELNGQPREVSVRDRALRVVERAALHPGQHDGGPLGHVVPAGDDARVVERAHPKGDPADPGQDAAPTAGVIIGIAVQANHAVERGAKLLTLEAMKMQSNLYAPISGRIVKILVTSGQHVEAKDLLVTIAP